jgi:hypothetical protein
MELSKMIILRSIKGGISMKTLQAKMLTRIKIHLMMGSMKIIFRIPTDLPAEGKVKFRRMKI